MDKERLEHIKKYVEDITGMLEEKGKSPNDSFLKDMIWLISTVEEQQNYKQALKKAVKIMQDYAIGDVQAEIDMMHFVEEWMGGRMTIKTYPEANERIKQQLSQSDDFKDQYAAARIVELEKEVAGLREALKFYADTENFDYYKGTGPFKRIEDDYGEKARQALEELK